MRRQLVLGEQGFPRLEAMVGNGPGDLSLDLAVDRKLVVGIDMQLHDTCALSAIVLYSTIRPKHK